MEKTKFYICCVLLLSLFPVACHKEFLERKPDKALLVPQTLDDLQALLDNTFIMNTAPGIQAIGDDDFYTTDEALNSFPSPYLKNSYLWEADIYSGEQVIADWSAPYEQIFYANIALEKLAELEKDGTGSNRLENLKGAALFYRALGHFLLTQVFAPAYDELKSTELLGVPLRLDSDVNAATKRSNLRETFDFILEDTYKAIELLPDKVSLKSRPSKHVVYAFLSRVYLYMRDYVQAEDMVDKALAIDPALLDYKSLNASANLPMPTVFQVGNPEVIYYYSLKSNRYLSSALTGVSRELYESYEAADLRRLVFFRDRGNGILTFKGSYNGANTINGQLFGGFANDELLLIKAECLARRGEVDEAIGLINRLRHYRFAEGSEQDTISSPTDKDAAVDYVLMERRRELVGRGLRWFDLKRLNLEADRTKTLQRTYGGNIYKLDPNSPRYVYPIPPEEIIGSGIQQNER